MKRATVFLSATITGISLLEIPYPFLQHAFALFPARFVSAPWTIITSMFVHVNIGHLIQNMVALVIFGAFLENIIKSKRFLSVYFTSGIAGGIAAFVFYPNSFSLGASGAIMGIVGCLTVLRPKASIWFFVHLPVIAFSALWVATDLIGLFVPSDIGNAAHLAGFACGIAFGRKWKRKFKEDREIRKRVRRALK